MQDIDEFSPRCKDERCQVRYTCLLYLDRDNPSARVRANKTLRKNWESHNLPCEFHQQYFGVLVDE